MFPEREEWQNTLAKRHGADLQKHLSEATVVICGLGGLGSNVALLLARVGIGKLILIDFDCVDLSNLHRQQYKVSQIGMLKTEAAKNNILEIAPYAEIVTHNTLINEENIGELLRDADIVCETFDNAETKAMLTNYILEHFPSKYLIAASGMSGFGSANSITTRRITEKFYICGDGISDISEGIGLVASRAAICAAHQAHTVLRILGEIK